jgi:SAM-dependent MidA family methyltransferase
MGSSHSLDAAASPSFLAAFRTRAGVGGVLPFAEFMALALYDAEVGYYRRDRRRVGYETGTDFYTASTSGPMFGELVAAAGGALLEGQAAGEHVFVEIGAEDEGGVLAGVKHPFAAVRTVRVGEPLALSGKCVVFSNELFDAQPFRRFVFRGAGWRELGVALQGDALIETEIGPVGKTAPALPASAPEGYVIDAPFAAVGLAEKIAAQPWTGLFVACDYGKSWREIVEATPAGTARAYHRHQQSNDLLARPGQQDLTCHVCWDWLAEGLSRHGFATPSIDSQEAFFIHHAGEFIAATSAAEAARFSPRKLSLLQLLHPSNLGQKFQVLHARRA